jgi:hypothetical protein
MKSFEMASKSILKKIKINKPAIKSENTLKELHLNLLDIFDDIFKSEDKLDIKLSSDQYDLIVPKDTSNPLDLMFAKTV